MRKILLLAFLFCFKAGADLSTGQTSIYDSNGNILDSTLNALNVYLTNGSGGTPFDINLTEVGGAPYALGANDVAHSIPITLASDQPAISVSGPLTDAQLRASEVPITSSSWYAQGLSSAGTIGPMVMGVASAFNPSPAESSLLPLSLDLGGRMRTTIETTVDVAGTVSVLQDAGSNPWITSAAQSGVWNTGRTWTLSAGTDSITVTGVSNLALSANQTNGSQLTQVVDASGNIQGPVQAIAGTNYMPVVLAASATPGSAVVPRSIQIAGTDATNARTLLTDSSGRIEIDTAQSLPLPSGASTAAGQSATQPRNITQFGGTNLATGTGASGAGIPRVTVANDSNILATQSGAWSTGRTWTLSSGTDSIACSATVSGTVAVTQSTSPWVTSASQSGTWTVQQGSAPWSMAGNVAAAATDSGNPVKIGGVYNSTMPTYTNGQRGDSQLNARGELAIRRRNKFTNVVGNVTSTIKSGAGELAAICFNNGGNSSTLTVYDNTAGSGTKLATIAFASNSWGTCAQWDAEFSTGLTVVVAGSASNDVTILYQ